MLKQLLFGFFGLITFSCCKRLEEIPYEPPVRADEWCSLQPCAEIGNIIISQPSSSIIVFFLATLAIAVAFYYLQTRNSQQSRFWWGISILLGGIGAALAGTSYQAFGYEIKCAGREFCVWTSWWEIGYEIFTVAGAGALLVGVAYSCFSKKWQNISWIYVFLNTLAYLIIVTIGVRLPDKFLVSFELMILFTAPAYLVILTINVWQYYQNRNHLLRLLIAAWVILFSTLGVYYFYLMSGYTQALWADGIWFSENDVLHVGMIGWIVYVYLVLGKSVKDKALDK